MNPATSVTVRAFQRRGSGSYPVGESAAVGASDAEPLSTRRGRFWQGEQLDDPEESPWPCSDPKSMAIGGLALGAPFSYVLLANSTLKSFRTAAWHPSKIASAAARYRAGSAGLPFKTASAAARYRAGSAGLPFKNCFGGRRPPGNRADAAHGKLNAVESSGVMTDDDDRRRGQGELIRPARSRSFR